MTLAPSVHAERAAQRTVGIACSVRNIKHSVQDIKTPPPKPPKKIGLYVISPSYVKWCVCPSQYTQTVPRSLQKSKIT